MGEFNHTTDPKGRLIIPPNSASSWGSGLSLPGAGSVFSWLAAERMGKITSQIAGLMTKKMSASLSAFCTAAVECEFDKQGRVNISATLLDYAQLKQACVVVGVATHFEIWDTATWQTINQQAAADFAAVAEELDFDF